MVDLQAGETTRVSWELERAEDKERWWIRDLLYTVQPRTPLSDDIFTSRWNEAVLWIVEELQFPDSRGFTVRTVNGYSYLSPLEIRDGATIADRAGKFQDRLPRLQKSFSSDLRDYHEEQERAMEEWWSADLDPPNLLTLLDLWRRVLMTFNRFWHLHFLIVIPRHAVAGMLEHAALDLAGVDSLADVGKLTQTHGTTKQLELDKALWELARRASDAGLANLFLDNQSADVAAALGETDEGRAWLTQLREFLDRFGARAVIPLELAAESWQEDPTPVLGTIRGYIAEGASFDFGRLEASLDAEREALTKQVLGRIADAAARESFAAMLESARAFQAAMEDDNYYYLWAGVQVRRVALGIGRRLAQAGALDAADGVFFLRAAEVEDALLDVASGLYDRRTYADRARERRGEWQSQLDLDPPAFLGDPPDEIHDFTLNHFWGINSKQQLLETTDAITGTGASGGVVEGIARHVRGPNDFGSIGAREILVCRATSPSWTPLFSKIAAVVTDQGGSLSHAAVVAREYGIPAVLGTIRATRVIPDGARVRVDGTSGRVELL